MVADPLLKVMKLGGDVANPIGVERRGKNKDDGVLHRSLRYRWEVAFKEIHRPWSKRASSRECLTLDRLDKKATEGRLAAPLVSYHADYGVNKVDCWLGSGGSSCLSLWLSWELHLGPAAIPIEHRYRSGTRVNPFRMLVLYLPQQAS